MLTSAVATALAIASPLALGDALLAMVAGIGGIFLGLPITILLYIDFLRNRTRADELEDSSAVGSFLLRVPAVLFGCLSILFGVAIVLWVLYNTLIARRPEYSGPAVFAGFGLGPALVVFGWQLVRTWGRQSEARSPTSGCS